MRNVFFGAAASLLCTTALAHAGGIERSAFNPGFLFEKGSFAEISYGSVSPDVSGTFFGVVSSGNVANTFSSLSASFKTDLSDKLSLGVIYDQPVGASVTYEAGTGYPFAGSSAEITSSQISAIGLYRLTPSVSVYGGLRSEKATGEAIVTAALAPYTLDKTESNAYGYVVGAAYEKPEIALRVALSYISAIDHDFTGTDTYSAFFGPVNFTTTVPQAWKLDVQSGVAQNTLVFGSIQWREWSEFQIVTRDGFTGIDPRVELSTGSRDTLSYTLGVGHKFSDTLSGAVSVGYEPAGGGLVGNLSPTDGYTSVTLAGIYAAPGGAKITVGGTYGMPGDATTSSIGGVFTDSSYLGFGVKVGWAF